MWNAGPGLWLRRLSLTSLIHYTGKNAVFLAPAQVLPLLQACVDDHRQPVEMALGWVLREMGHVHPEAIDDFLQHHAASLSARALARAVEGRAAEPRARLLRLKQPAGRRT